MTKPLLLLIVLVYFGCASPVEHAASDKTLSKKDAPTFLIDATPRGEHVDQVEYFIRKSADLETYELKYEDHEKEVSVHFSKEGKRLKTEQNIEFESLTSEVKNKIRDYLKHQFTNYKIIDTEFRTDALNIKFIDVEVSHTAGKTGLSEITFSTGGVYISEEDQHTPEIETLN